MTAADTGAWRDYWQTLPRGRLLFQPEAIEFVRNLRAALPLSQDTKMLDFGCGYGGITRLIAPLVHSVAYWDATESMRAAAQENLADCGNASLWGGGGRFDLIVVNSVVQYMSEEELRERLEEWSGLLESGGRIVLSDLMFPGHAAANDMRSLLWFSLRRGYLLRALRNTLAERARYRRTAAAAPLLHVRREWLESAARRAGLQAAWLPENLTHFRTRHTAVLTKS